MKCKFLVFSALFSAALVFAVPASAQLPVIPPPAPIDFSKVEMTTTRLGDNLYEIQANGSTMQPTAVGVLVGPDGIFMVDDEYAQLSDKLLAAIKAISNQPIRFIVNTHVHSDHTGGNEKFAKLGATVIARDEVRQRLAHPSITVYGTPGVPVPVIALPLETFEGSMKFYMNGEDIDLIPIPHAHTDGDTLVYFDKADVIMTGDFYRSIQWPNIDRVNGGSLEGLINGLGVVVGLAGPNTKIVPGHGAVVTRADVMGHRDIILGVRDKVAQMIAQGKTEEQIVNSHPTAEYDPHVVHSDQRREAFVMQVWSELTGTK